MPETWEADKNSLEVVGEQEITLQVPTHKEYDHERILCKHCGEDFKGTHGLSVHLSRVNDSMHPEDATVETSGLRVPVGPDDSVVVDEEILDGVQNHNIDPDDFSDVSVLEAHEGREGGGEETADSDTPEGHVPIPDLVELVTFYERDGKTEAAEELRGLIQRYA